MARKKNKHHADQTGITRVSNPTIATTAQSINEDQPITNNKKSPMIFISGIVLLIAVIAAYNIYFPSKTIANVNSFTITGFLPEYRLHSRDFNFLCSKTTHIILFSFEIDQKSGALTETNRFDSFFLNLTSSLTCSVILGIGGAGRSGGYAAMTSDIRKRTKFIKSLGKYEKLVQGVELNWQFPSSIDELKNLRSLLEELKSAYPKFMISMAVPPTDSFAEALKSLGLHKMFDLFHIMAYQAGVGGGAKGIERSRKALKQVIKYLPSENCTLGIPFYGQHVENGGIASYEQFIGNAVDEEDKLAIDGPKEVGLLVDLAKTYKLRGVSIWELGQDCRVVKFGEHSQTCPNGLEDSLLQAVFYRANSHITD